ncbi:hypothetical protein VKT23_018634 [Stygiomarasmius scandens]|uniref:Uncharacterized protein n=1 Tax=Marasmiellus scandens TaxID=2682957 RepID=A0ABR1IRM0_9AGAR
MLNRHVFNALTRLPPTSTSTFHRGQRRWKASTTSSERKLYKQVQLQGSQVGQESFNEEGVKKMPISTLDPGHLKPSDLMDLSGHKLPLFRFASVAYRTYYAHNGTDHFPFPPNTRGYFYLHQTFLGALPETTKSIRFRLCKDPSEFNKSKDLLRPDGSPWQLHIWQLLSQKQGRLLVQKLIKEGYVSERVLKHRQELLTHIGLKRFPGCQFLRVLGEPINVRMGRKTCSVAVLGEDAFVHPLEFVPDVLQPFLGSKDATGFAKITFDYDEEEDQFLVRLLQVPEQYRGKTSVAEGDALPLTIYRFRPGNRQNERKALDILVPESRRRRKPCESASGT